MFAYCLTCLPVSAANCNGVGDSAYTPSIKIGKLLNVTLLRELHSFLFCRVLLHTPPYHFV